MRCERLYLICILYRPKYDRRRIFRHSHASLSPKHYISNIYIYIIHIIINTMRTRSAHTHIMNIYYNIMFFFFVTVRTYNTNYREKKQNKTKRNKNSV